MKRILILLAFSMLVLAGCGSANAAEYRDSIEDVSEQIIDNSADVETLLGYYTVIWKFSIENSNPIPVSDMANFTGMDEDTVREHFEINVAGNVTNDFTSNVNSLKSYYESIGDIGQIEEVADEIKGKISDLNDPPKDYEKVYEELLILYDLSEEFKEMLINPSGNLQTFSQNINDLSGEITSKNKRIEVIMPSDD
ncbi:hypothetical protein [Oceanobacillus sojae]|uniref:hypothetical protein n=1 Tax=Oceanobacillus sojae TaxID=582851 RepID=UPI0021A30221|nr:hypothetical protein [Oceanobacillus sojae]MCT1904101.1 hypothetical protein [Oceanobacillus sojae]